MSLISAKTRILLKMFYPQRKTPDPRHAIPEADKDLSGKTIVFTGGTNGIGRIASETLYQMGANLVLLSRSESVGAEVVAELVASGGRGSVSFLPCDLSSMSSVKVCAKRILAEHQRIDVLVNNAGIFLNKPTITADGFETNWAINYLGPYLLTQLLLERIKESAPSRIVNLTTDTEFLSQIDFDDIATKPDFDTGNPYAEAKLSMNMFSIDLARSLEGSGVTVNYLYPGYIRTNLLNKMEGAERIMAFFMRVMASPPEVGADRIVRLVVSSEFQGVNGVYVSEDDIKPHHAEAQSDAKRAQIKQITDKALSRWL